MVVRLVLWSLAGSELTVADLRRYLRDEAVEAISGVPGLRLALWLSDEATERWGALTVWESAEAARQAVPTRAAELIGHEPDLAEEFDLEASALGEVAAELSRRGLAFEA